MKYEIIKLLLDKPIAVNPVLIKITDSFSGAILLSQAIYWEKTMGKEYWKTNESWMNELHMSEREFTTARKKTAKFLKIRKIGLPAKNHYSIDWEALESALSSQLQNRSDQYPTKVGSLETYESGVTISETTTETTTETTKKNNNTISATQSENSTLLVSASKTATNEEFEAFWKTYPRKVNKLAAKKAYEKAIKGDKKKDNPPVSALDILSGLQKQLKFKTFSHEMKYIPHPATWLNSGAFYNEIDEQEMAEKTDELPIYPIWKIIKDDAKLRGWWQDCQDNEETYKNEPNPDCRFPAIPMFNSWLKKEGYQFRAKLI